MQSLKLQQNPSQKMAIGLNGLNKFKSLCFGNSKHIFNFKIVQVFPEKNASKPNAKFTLYTVYSTTV
jgi:hypothetical protein